jgi:hypothetical protein
MRMWLKTGFGTLINNQPLMLNDEYTITHL